MVVVVFEGCWQGKGDVIITDAASGLEVETRVLKDDGSNLTGCAGIEYDRSTTTETERVCCNGTSLCQRPFRSSGYRVDSYGEISYEGSIGWFLGSLAW